MPGGLTKTFLSSNGDNACCDESILFILFKLIFFFILTAIKKRPMAMADIGNKVFTFL